MAAPLQGNPLMVPVPGVEASAHAVTPWTALAYLVAGVLFILALRGLSSPATARRGNRFGMAGMLIAVVTTLVTHLPLVLIRWAGSDVVYGRTRLGDRR